MPKGPQGQKRPADSIARAVMIGKIATGEISDEIPSGRGRSAGGLKRAEVLSEAERKLIATAAAKARWNNKGVLDMQTAKKETVARGQQAACMYPNNSLGDQKKDFKNAFSGFDMLRDRFNK